MSRYKILIFNTKELMKIEGLDLIKQVSSAVE
jgi:hypothetical protein